MEREWSNAEANFDNIGEAMLTLFASSTTEGWVGVMHNGVDSTNPGEGPIEDNRPYMALFFVVYIIAMHFFMINVFVGYVVMTFASEGKRVSLALPLLPPTTPPSPNTLSHEKSC